jgi:hypothetical protein
LDLPPDAEHVEFGRVTTQQMGGIAKSSLQIEATNSNPEVPLMIRYGQL